MKDIDMFFPHNDPKTEFVLENPYMDMPDLKRPLSRRERRKKDRQDKKRKVKSS